MQMKKKIAVFGALALAGAMSSVTAHALSTVVGSRSPFQWPSFLGTLDQSGLVIAHVDGSADLSFGTLSVDYVRPPGTSTYDIDVFQLVCLLNSPNNINIQNLTSDYNHTQECPGWFIGNALVQANFSLKTP